MKAIYLLLAKALIAALEKEESAARTARRRPGGRGKPDCRAAGRRRPGREAAV